MKNTIILLFLTAVVLCSCEKDQIQRYDLGRYVYFGVKETKDTTVSFSHYPEMDELTLRFGMEMTGELPDKDMNFQLGIDPKETTATPETYSVDLNPVFRKRMSKDTISVTLKNPNDMLRDKEVVLVLHVLENQNFQPGFVDNRTLTIRFNNKVSKPLWWDATVEIYLGAYSEAKFRAFVECTHVASLAGMDEPTIQNLARQFKKYVEDNDLPFDDIPA